VSMLKEKDAQKDAQILIVDDQEGIRNLLLETCLMLGYEAIATGSGEEALTLVENHDFQGVLLDVRMPGFDGRKTLEQILREGKKPRIIIISGYCDCEKKLEELSANPLVDAVLKKPFQLQELQALLEKKIKQ